MKNGGLRPKQFVAQSSSSSSHHSHHRKKRQKTLAPPPSPPPSPPSTPPSPPSSPHERRRRRSQRRYSSDSASSASSASDDSPSPPPSRKRKRRRVQKTIPLEKEHEYIKYKDMKKHLLNSLKSLKNDPDSTLERTYRLPEPAKAPPPPRREHSPPPPPAPSPPSPPPPSSPHHSPPKKSISNSTTPAKVPNSYPTGKVDPELKYRNSCIHPKTGRKCSIWETPTGLKGAALATGGKSVWVYDHEGCRWEKIERGRLKKFLSKSEARKGDAKTKFDFINETKSDVKWSETGGGLLIKML